MASYICFNSQLTKFLLRREMDGEIAIVLFPEKMETLSDDKDIAFLTSDSDPADDSGSEKCSRMLNLSLTIVANTESASHSSVLM